MNHDDKKPFKGKIDSSPLFASVSNSFVILAAGWTILVLLFFLHNIIEIRNSTRDMAVKEATVHLRKDHAIRLWAALHGGVYVPSTSMTPPNPYLVNIPDRDIVTPGGTPLTLMNPAYMVRQLMDYYEDLYRVKSHITSLNYFRPETAPDGWETASLREFEKGVPEIREFTSLNGEPCLRVMKPILTEQECLKCHGHQGYKVGDIRGGVSVSLPIKDYLSVQKSEMLWHLGSFSLIWLTGMGVMGFMIQRIKRQVDARERAEYLQRLTEKQFRILVDGLPIGIYIVKDGVIVFANIKASEIYGYPVEALIGMESILLVHPDDRDYVVETRQKRLGGEDIPEYQIRGLRKDGEIIWVKRKHTVMDQDGKKSIVAAIEDITALKQAKTALELYSEELKRSNQELDRFASIVSHDLKEPLRKIKIFGDLLLQENRQLLKAKGIDYIERMGLAAIRMQKLIDSLLNYSQISRQKDPFMLMNIGEPVAESLKNLEVLILETRADIQVDHLPTIEADRLQMIQLFQNLISNALKFHKKNQPPRIRIYSNDPSGEGMDQRFSEIFVEDNGIGFDEVHADRIFAPFERLDEVREGYEGTGVGLAICRKIVEYHGGSISAGSSPGKGATFIIKLPKTSSDQRKNGNGNETKTEPSL